MKSGSHKIYSEQKVGLLIVFLGISFLISALVINPWIGRYWRGSTVNYQDVMIGYFVWISVLGALLVSVGILLVRVHSKMMGQIATLFATISLLVLLDKLLLATFGLPLWVPDSENHYKHRPNAIRSWGPGYENKLIRINSYGHHDDDFPTRKLQNEFRGIILGDSITMGHGVTHEETFSNQLEALLKVSDTNHRKYQIINTGVQGYSTFQEYHVLERSLIFEPQFIAVGFCMNDVTEPFVVNRDFGGVGVDYHEVMQTANFLASYLLNETGYGRLLQKWRSGSKSREVEKMWSMHSVKYMASHPQNDPKTAMPWRVTLSYLEKIYEVAKGTNIHVVLLIFPETFQLMDDNFKIPQQILIAHAKQAGVNVIDFTPIFEEIIFDKPVVRFLREHNYSYGEIRELQKHRIARYFLDEDHYTVEGHRIIASILYEYLHTHFPSDIATTSVE